MVKYILFDLDGTLIDSMNNHVDAWKKAFVDHGIDVEEQELAALGGVNQDETIDIISQEHHIGIDEDMREEIKSEKEKLFDKKFNVRVFPGVLSGLSSLKEKGFSLSLVTGAHGEIVHDIVSHVFEDYFDCVITADDVENGKPAADPYLLAVEKLGIDSSECLVIEDSVMGIRSAKSAGVKTIAITTSNPKEKLYEADIIIDSHEKLFRYLESLS